MAEREQAVCFLSSDGSRRRRGTASERLQEVLGAGDNTLASNSPQQHRMHLPAQLQVQRLQRQQAGEADEAGVRYGLVALQAQLAQLL